MLCYTGRNVSIQRLKNYFVILADAALDDSFFGFYSMEAENIWIAFTGKGYMAHENEKKDTAAVSGEYIGCADIADAVVSESLRDNDL